MKRSFVFEGCKQSLTNFKNHEKEIESDDFRVLTNFLKIESWKCNDGNIFGGKATLLKGKLLGKLSCFPGPNCHFRRFRRRSRFPTCKTFRTQCAARRQTNEWSSKISNRVSSYQDFLYEFHFFE